MKFETPIEDFTKEDYATVVWLRSIIEKEFSQYLSQRFSVNINKINNYLNNKITFYFANIPNIFGFYDPEDKRFVINLLRLKELHDNNNRADVIDFLVHEFTHRFQTNVGELDEEEMSSYEDVSPWERPFEIGALVEEINRKLENGISEKDILNEYSKDKFPYIQHAIDIAKDKDSAFVITSSATCPDDKEFRGDVYPIERYHKDTPEDKNKVRYFSGKPRPRRDFHDDWYKPGEDSSLFMETNPGTTDMSQILNKPETDRIATLVLEADPYFDLHLNRPNPQEDAQTQQQFVNPQVEQAENRFLYNNKSITNIKNLLKYIKKECSFITKSYKEFDIEFNIKDFTDERALDIGKTKFTKEEIDDIKARVNNTINIVVDHYLTEYGVDILPILENIKFIIDTGNSYTPKTKELRIDIDLPDNVMSMMHEIRHIINLDMVDTAKKEVMDKKTPYFLRQYEVDSILAEMEYLRASGQSDDQIIETLKDEYFRYYDRNDDERAFANNYLEVLKDILNDKDKISLITSQVLNIVADDSNNTLIKNITPSVTKNPISPVTKKPSTQPGGKIQLKKPEPSRYGVYPVI